MTNNITIDLSIFNNSNDTQINSLCMGGIEVNTMQQLENIVYTDLFNQVVNKLYSFVFISCLLNFVILYFQFNHFLKYDKKLKVMFVINMGLQFGIYIFVTYLKFLIFYKIWNLAIFFLMTLPFFYFINNYSWEITGQFYTMLTDNMIKKFKK